MGLFTSTKELFGSSRLLKLDVTTPFDITLSVHDGHQDFEKLAKDFLESRVCALAVTSLKRWYMAPGVRRTLVHEGRLRGALFLPPGDGPFPGIVDVFGMAGGLLDFRAALLASHGFATFALAYIAYKDLTDNPLDLQTSYFIEAINWFSRHPNVTRGGIGMVANCAGGNFCLTVAALSPQVKVVVSTNANPILLALDVSQFGDVHVNHCEFDVSKGTITDDGLVLKHMFRDYVIRDHLIPIWQRDVKVLIIAGEADLCTNVALQREFEAAIPLNKKNNFRFVYYPGAGHLIEAPYSPHCPASYSKFHNMVVLWGGDPVYHLPAQEDAWREVLAFLNKHLAMRSQL